MQGFKTIDEILEFLDLPKDQLLTEYDVARIKKKAVQTLRNDRHLGRGLPYIKDGRNVRYTPYDVAADILNSRIDPAAA